MFKMTENQFLFVLTFLFVLLTHQTYLSLADEGGGKTLRLEDRRRSPAMVQGQSTHTAIKKIFSYKLVANLDCPQRKVSSVSKPSSSLSGSVDAIKVTSPYVHIKGNFCVKDFFNNPFVINNETNGYEATIFELPNEQFRTDYIHLKEGENQIKIRYVSDQSIEKIKNIRVTFVPEKEEIN